jgi:FAD/FMN-containing dehydrogenase
MEGLKTEAPTHMNIRQGLSAALKGQGDIAEFPSKLLYQFEDAKPYNLDYPITPAAVTYPKTPEQIAAIIKYASTANLKVQARSGGHSYANYGTSHHPYPNQTNPISQGLGVLMAPS